MKDRSPPQCCGHDVDEILTWEYGLEMFTTFFCTTCGSIFRSWDRPVSRIDTWRRAEHGHDIDEPKVFAWVKNVHIDDGSGQ